MNKREAVSRVINSSKNLNKDERISRRYVLSVLNSIAKTLISQKLLDRTVINERNLYTSLKCVEFSKEDVVRCPIVEFRRCDVLMKSKKPLPEPIFSRLGTSIINVESVDGVTVLTEIDKKQYQRNKKRRFKLNDEVFIYIGEDYHLYIPDHEIYSINLDLMTMENDNTECSECGNDECRSGWDYEFICPDKLLKTVFDLTIQEIFGRRQITEDQNPNNIERQ